jgi:hypothetical protein
MAKQCSQYTVWIEVLLVIHWNLYVQLDMLYTIDSMHFQARPEINNNENMSWLNRSINLTMATIATDKFTRIAYKQKKPKNAHTAKVYRAGSRTHADEVITVGSTLYSSSDRCST